MLSTLVVVAGFLVPFGVLALIPFDPPGVLQAGRLQEAFRANYPTLALVVALPLISIVALDEDFAAWKTWRGILGRALTWAVFAPVYVLFVAFSLFAYSFAFPFLTNALLRPPVRSWDLPVIGIEMRNRQSRSCAKRLYFADPTVSDHTLDLCAEYDPELRKAQIGDRLRITGRSGPFGITYSTVELVED